MPPLSRLSALLLSLCCLLGSAPAARGEPIMQIGVGVNYWRALDDTFDESFDRDGLGWLISTRIMPSWPIHLGLEIERSPDNFVELEEPIYAPAAFLIVGRGIYAALGAGMYYYDGTLYTDWFYIMRAGLMTELLPSLYLDINANYRFDQLNKIRDEFSEIDTDNVTLGAALRLEF